MTYQILKANCDFNYSKNIKLKSQKLHYVEEKFILHKAAFILLKIIETIKFTKNITIKISHITNIKLASFKFIKLCDFGKLLCFINKLFFYLLKSKSFINKNKLFKIIKELKRFFNCSIKT